MDKDEIYQNLQKDMIVLIKNADNPGYVRGLAALWSKIEKQFPEQVEKFGKED